LKRLLQEKDVHGALPVDPGSDSDDSSLQDLGEVTQFGLTEALAQMANLSFMAGAPGNYFFSFLFLVFGQIRDDSKSDSFSQTRLNELYWCSLCGTGTSMR